MCKLGFKDFAHLERKISISKTYISSGTRFWNLQGVNPSEMCWSEQSLQLLADENFDPLDV